MRLAHQYAALLREVEDRPETVAQIFTLLSKRGHRKLLPAILAEIQRLDAKQEKVGKTVLTVARAADEASAKKATSTYGVPDTTVVDPAIIGGWRFRNTGTLVDHSYKRMLLDLYRTVTS